VKEIIAIIRPKMMSKTKIALGNMGVDSITAYAAYGRGKQRGIAEEVDIAYRPHVLDEAAHRGMKYVPKRYLAMVVRDSDADEVVKTLIQTNQTGQIGDGKIFVCPVDDALRIRTKETGDSALI
jgi:nitrogen regulatory protein PII 2